MSSVGDSYVEVTTIPTTMLGSSPLGSAPEGKEEGRVLREVILATCTKVTNVENNTTCHYDLIMVSFVINKHLSPQLLSIQF